MNLVIIYGPPAVGKLTVARELAKLTGYTLFHNHLTNDLVEAIFPYGSPEYVKTVDRYRLDLFRTAASEGIKGMIFTFVFVRGEDEVYVRKIMKIIKKSKGTTYFVQLSCTEKELVRRVHGKSRKEHGKIMSAEKLLWILRNRPVHDPVPFKPNITIVNTKLSPRRAAMQIIRYFKFRRKVRRESAPSEVEG